MNSSTWRGESFCSRLLFRRLRGEGLSFGDGKDGGSGEDEGGLSCKRFTSRESMLTCEVLLLFHWEGEVCIVDAAE